MAPETRAKPQVAIMNAVHDLPVLVARDKGFFRDEGLDLEFVTTPGMAQVTTSHTVKFDSVFERPLDSVYYEMVRHPSRSTLFPYTTLFRIRHDLMAGRR